MLNSRCSTLFLPSSFTYRAPAPSTRERAFTSKVRFAGMALTSVSGLGVLSSVGCYGVAGLAELGSVAVKVASQPHDVARGNAVGHVMAAQADRIGRGLRSAESAAIAIG